jgi:hypothetical protein
MGILLSILHFQILAITNCGLILSQREGLTLETFIASIRGLPTHSPTMPVYDGVHIKESPDKNYRISLKLPQER